MCQVTVGGKLTEERKKHQTSNKQTKRIHEWLGEASQPEIKEPPKKKYFRNYSGERKRGPSSLLLFYCLFFRHDPGFFSVTRVRLNLFYAYTRLAICLQLAVTYERNYVLFYFRFFVFRNYVSYLRNSKKSAQVCPRVQRSISLGAMQVFLAFFYGSLYYFFLHIEIA